jgi:hypothetical protein
VPSRRLPLILDLLEQKPDITLADIQAELARAGVAAGIGTIWRFFDRHRITRKKRMARPVCNGEIGWHVGLHQRIRSQGVGPGQDGFRAFQAS